MITPLSATKPRTKCAICKYWNGEKPDIPVLNTYVIETENTGICSCDTSVRYNTSCASMNECECFEFDNTYSTENILKVQQQQTHLHIPACVESTIKEIGCCFLPFLSLEEVTVDENNKKYTAIDGVLFSKDKKRLLLYPMMKKDETYEIPEGTKEAWFCSDYPNLKILHLPKSLNANDKVVSCAMFFSIFTHCELDTLDIGKNTSILEFIGLAAEMNNRSVKEFRVDDDNEKFCCIDGALYTKDGKTLLLCPSHKKDLL